MNKECSFTLLRLLIYVRNVDLVFLSLKEMKKDNIYAKPIDKVIDFEFNEQVSSVFDDMIKRSVPGYNSINNLLKVIANHHVQKNTHIYDLGCSLGSSSIAILQGAKGKECNFVAVDLSNSMITQCKRNLKPYSANEKIEILCEDIRNIHFTNANLVILNFTLQFIPKNDRNNLICKIKNGMLDNGILILSEKIQFEDPQYHHQINTLHNTFKKKNGYTDLEISQKRTALEKVLTPETINNHHQRLTNAGFRSVQTWFQYLNFTSIIAFK